MSEKAARKDKRQEWQEKDAEYDNKELSTRENEGGSNTYKFFGFAKAGCCFCCKVSNLYQSGV